MVFNLYDTNRLAAWREFRDSLEQSKTPFNDVAEFWSKAPFVSPYLNPKDPSIWPDPWHLILDNRLDDLAIALGMLYTLSLTQRFKDSHFKILELDNTEQERHYILLVDNNSILNLEYNEVVELDSVKLDKISIIWSQ
jgi:hypothetical protein